MSPFTQGRRCRNGFFGSFFDSAQDVTVYTRQALQKWILRFFLRFLLIRLSKSVVNGLSFVSKWSDFGDISIGKLAFVESDDDADREFENEPCMFFTEFAIVLNFPNWSIRSSKRRTTAT
ncbi:hypothetical protein GCK32_017971 [Trichostrongylus colubriformis]|uniref:Uncharacterized protein n=1 Tax=Trichostrongylus colubriformis TaxID=6319 RepID=A0AAN8G187_TRICO